MVQEADPDPQPEVFFGIDLDFADLMTDNNATLPRWVVGEKTREKMKLESESRVFVVP